MTRVFVTGGNGQLGRCLASSKPVEIEAQFLPRDEFDVTDPQQMKSVIDNYHPDVVVNCAAYTNVDGAETERELASAINEIGVRDLAQLCADQNVKLIHVSTDFVFSGSGNEPYEPHHPGDPQGVYGQTKLAGEIAIKKVLADEALVIRTSWLYSEYENNFVKTMLKLFETKEQFQVVDDQFGSPTYARDLADLIWHVIETPFQGGVLHWSNSGIISWYDFAVKIGELGLSLGVINQLAQISPIAAADYGAKAPRPAFSALDCSDTLKRYPKLTQLDWADALEAMLERLKAQRA